MVIQLWKRADGKIRMLETQLWAYRLDANYGFMDPFDGFIQAGTGIFACLCRRVMYANRNVCFISRHVYEYWSRLVIPSV